MDPEGLSLPKPLPSVDLTDPVPEGHSWKDKPFKIFASLARNGAIVAYLLIGLVFCGLKTELFWLPRVWQT
jgi:hypothetical protein